MTPPFEPRPPADINLRMQVAQTLLGPLSFKGTAADLECPGKAMHSVKDKRLARVYLDGSPTISCFHASCEQRLESINQQLRSEIYKAERAANGQPRTFVKWFPRTADMALEPLAQKYWRAMGQELLRAARTMCPLSPADLWEQSPLRPPENLDDHFRLFMERLWDPMDRIWCGNIFDSGKLCHAANFLHAAEWLKKGRAPGPLTTGWTFLPQSVSRCKEAAFERKYLVLESDKLSQEDCISVFWWLREKMQLRLRMVVHSGNRSIHGWFELPHHQLPQLEACLPEAGFDPKLFTPSQPCRLPGWHRTDKAALPQRLMYLAP